MKLERGTFVCVLNGKTGKVDFIPRGEYSRGPRSRMEIIPDLEPYRNVIDGKPISGRKQHRDFLRAHDCIEVGNERIKRPPPSNKPDMGIVNELKRAMGRL